MKRVKGFGRVSPGVGVLVMVLIVLGIVGVGFLSQKSKERVTAPVTVSDHQKQEKRVPGLLLVNGSAVSVVRPDGNMERMTFEGFSAAYPKAFQRPLIGADAALGMSRVLPSLQAKTVIGEFMSADGNYRASMQAAKSDGASVVALSRGNEKPRLLVMRDRKGKPFLGAQLHGWFDERHLALTGRTTSTMVVVSMDVDGRMEQLGQVPDGLAFIQVSGGVLFAVTSAQDRGLESEAQGPSRIIAFAPQAGLEEGCFFQNNECTWGSDSLIRRVWYAPGTNRFRFAYTTEDGMAYWVAGHDQTYLGKLHPLMFVGEEELLTRNGFELDVLNIVTGTTTHIGNLPEGEVTIFPFVD